MNKEIERKYLVKYMPDLTGIKIENQERYFLELGNIEKRITRIDDKYIYEEKLKGNGLTAEKIKKIINNDEFEELKKKAIKSLVRKSYILSIDPEISIKVYSGEYEGLLRAEFEFQTEEEAKKFVEPKWLGAEITETEIGRDGKLIELDRAKFLSILGDIIRLWTEDQLNRHSNV